MHTIWFLIYYSLFQKLLMFIKLRCIHNLSRCVHLKNNIKIYTFDFKFYSFLNDNTHN